MRRCPITLYAIEVLLITSNASSAIFESRRNVVLLLEPDVLLSNERHNSYCACLNLDGSSLVLDTRQRKFCRVDERRVYGCQGVRVPRVI